MRALVPSFSGSRHFSNVPLGKPATTAIGRVSVPSDITLLMLVSAGAKVLE